MRKTIAVAFLALALAGCTAAEPRVDDPTVSQVPPPAPDQPPVYEVPSPTHSVTPDSSGTSTENCYVTESSTAGEYSQNKKECIQTLMRVCLVPTSGVKQYVQSADPQAKSPVVMVGVGVGTTPGERWWVVGWKSTNVPGHSEDGFAVYLTNEPSLYQPSGVQWITIGQGWGNVAWTENRLAFGQVAERTAISCL